MFDSKGRVGTFGPVHPGSILREDFIAPLGLTAGRVAEACGLARTRIEPIVAEDIGISEDTAIRLGRVFRITPQFWMNSQLHYDVARAASAMDSAVTLWPASPQPKTRRSSDLHIRQTAKRGPVIEQGAMSSG